MSKRLLEHAKYIEAYKGVYGMGRKRKSKAFDEIDKLHETGSFLDVGCGRGEVMEYALNYFNPVKGIEVVPYLLNDDVVFGEIYGIPFDDNSFDVVTCFDVLEHILPEDTIISLKELNRVYRKAMILSAANYESYCNGIDLHINKRPYDAWDALIRDYIEGDVKRLPNSGNSAMWVIRR